jgi:hypothetical protein
MSAVELGEGSGEALMYGMTVFHTIMVSIPSLSHALCYSLDDPGGNSSLLNWDLEAVLLLPVTPRRT